jgi:hypothetical protein
MMFLRVFREVCVLFVNDYCPSHIPTPQCKRVYLWLKDIVIDEDLIKLAGKTMLSAKFLQNLYPWVSCFWASRL